MGEIHGGRIVAKYLKSVEGIDIIFSLSGGHIMPIYDGCLEEDLRIIDVRHEQAAVMMAHSWSIYSGLPGVCLVTAGPGFTNSLTGVVNAFLENVPVVILSGMVALRDLDRGALQDMDQMSMIKPVVKWAGRCQEIRRIPEYLQAAIRMAISGRPGPTYLEIAPEALYSSMDQSELNLPARATARHLMVPDQESLNKAIDLINGAERPLLVGGSGVGLSDCQEQLRVLVDKTGIPYMLLNNGRGVLPDEHPLSLWDGGLAGMLAAFSMADVILAVGIRFNWVLNYGEPFAKAKVIRVDIHPPEIDRNRAADVGLVGDAGHVLDLLNRGLERKNREEWVRSLKGIFATLTGDEQQQMETTSDPIHPLRLVRQLREATRDEAVHVVDGGDTLYFGLIGLRAKERAGVIGSGTLFGCLGTGVPFAIGAKLAQPQKNVVLLTGDGSFGFNAMEMETAVRHQIPIVAVICNDCAWGMVKHSQELFYDPSRVYCTELGVVHYEKMVEALGGHGELVSKDEEILPAIRRALESGKPACVNVLTDPTVTSPATLLFAEGFKI